MLALRLGGSLPLHAGAVAQALLAFAPSAVGDNYLERGKLESFHPRFPRRPFERPPLSNKGTPRLVADGCIALPRCLIELQCGVRCRGAHATPGLLWRELCRPQAFSRARGGADDYCRAGRAGSSA